MKFEQGYYTLRQMEDMFNVHSDGKVHILEAHQENNQLVITTSNNLKFKIRIK